MTIQAHEFVLRPRTGLPRSSRAPLGLGGTGPGETAMLSSVEQHGITWYFDQEYPVGKFVTGDWWVVGPVEVVKINPGSYLNSDGRVKNGSMLDPIVSNLHGFDSYPGRPADNYRSELNVAHGISSGSPLALSSGSSLVSTISHDSPSDTTRPSRIGAVLTVLDAQPPANSFRPPYVQGDKTVQYTTADVRSDLLPSLSRASISVPAPQAPTRVHFDHGRNWTRGHTIPTENNSNYGRDVAHRFDQFFGTLISDFPLSEKEPLLHWMVQAGIDLYGIADWSIKNGISPWSPDGGWSHGRKMPIVFAGYMLNNTDMLKITHRAGGCFFQEDAMYDYVGQGDIDATNSDNWRPIYPNRGTPQPYSQDMLGMPEWLASRCRHNPERKFEGRSDWGGHPYRGANIFVHHMAALGMLAMGLKEQWGEDAFFDFAHRFVAVMEGSIDPFGVGKYGSVSGVPGEDGAEGWRQWWHSKWRYEMFKAHWASYYPRGAERNADTKAAPLEPILRVE